MTRTELLNSLQSIDGVSDVRTRNKTVLLNEWVDVATLRLIADRLERIVWFDEMQIEARAKLAQAEKEENKLKETPKVVQSS